MCIVCGVYCYRKKQLEENPEYKMSLPRSRLSSQSGMHDRDMNYDKSYKTNEPLAGKPNSEFPEKKWDLEDEDILSSDGSDFRDTKIAKDIEYINGEKPKQQGRRALRQQSDYNPIEEEEEGYPPPIDSPSPGNYSPSYSGVDRNSSFMNDQPQKAPSQAVGGIRVLPTQNTFYGEPPISPNSLNQDVGLPKTNSKSTEV